MPAFSLPPPIPCSLGYNEIGGKGASAFAAILKETKITDLKCAATPKCLHFCQRPMTHLCFSFTISAQLPAYSLESNHIGDEGVTKLAEVLSQTKITILR